jgi:hypothetical protein
MRALRYWLQRLFALLSRCRRRWLGLSRVAHSVIGTLLFVIVAGIGFASWYLPSHCTWTIAKIDGQCVGITDGTDGIDFGPGTGDALRFIGEENARIAAEATAKPSVTIAYVVPIPPAGVEDAYAQRLRGDLMGVAVAQRRANRTQTAGDLPTIRMLVVNVGDSAKPATKPITTLIEMTRGTFAKDRLMAVAVSGKSLDPLIGQLDLLVAAKVPVIVSRLTAEQVTTIAPSPAWSLVRVAPTTADEAAAAATYLRASSGRVLIVQNSDPGDRYAQSLGKAFRARYPDASHTVTQRDETYNGSEDGVANTMRGILRTVCERRPDVVFFAGRSTELAALVAALPFRPCLDFPVRVMTGDDGVGLARALASGVQELRSGLLANASIQFTAVAHPGAWPASPNAFAPGSTFYLTAQCAECFPTLFPGQSVDDSYAIMAYDAIMTAVTGIRSANGPVNSPGALIQEFKRMHDAGAVAGASGWISLTANGEPINKAVPILSIGPDGQTQFLQLSSPSGTPCTPDRC